MINSARCLRRFRKGVTPAIIARAPRVGVIIAAAPAAVPAIRGHRSQRSDVSMLARAAEAATIENSVVNQWWLPCVGKVTCDRITHAVVRRAESGASLAACWQARNVKQAVPTMVRITNTRAD